MNLLEVDVHEVHSSNERLSRDAASTSQGDARLQRHVLKHTRTSTDTSHHLKTSRGILIASLGFPFSNGSGTGKTGLIQ